jgi:hypothetical protein
MNAWSAKLPAALTINSLGAFVSGVAGLLLVRAGREILQLFAFRTRRLAFSGELQNTRFCCRQRHVMRFVLGEIREILIW